MNLTDLPKLAEGWRAKAQSLRERHRSPDPGADIASNAALAIETCAEDLEKWLRDPVEMPNAS